MKHSIFLSGLKLAAKTAGAALIAGLFATSASAGNPADGEYVIRQKSNLRYLDAYTNAADANDVVTRPQQGNDSQVWIITRHAQNGYRIQQKYSGEFLDVVWDEAHLRYSVVTKRRQNVQTQFWTLKERSDGVFTIRNSANSGFMDAYQGSNDNSANLVQYAGADSHKWVIARAPGIVVPPITIDPPIAIDPPLKIDPTLGQLSGTYTIVQQSSMRFMDAHEGTRNNSAVTRPRQNDPTQMWIIQPLGNNLYTIRQRSSQMFLDAYVGNNDHDVVTRLAKNTAQQQWIIIRDHGLQFTIRQRSSGRYLDAHKAANNDFRVVTRNRQDNRTQQWIIRPAN
jgi:hypothetical protein